MKVVVFVSASDFVRTSVEASPKVSVIVPHYRDLRALDLCLRALQKQTYAEPFEIIVADNDSPEGEIAVARTVAGRARLVIVHEKGAGPARNGGVAAATGNILAFTDCDCQPEAEWLAEGVRALSDYDFVGGHVKVLVDDCLRMTATEAFERVFAFDNESYVRRKGFTVTASLFCTRLVFDRVGGFRSGVSEDVEWSHRARAKGYSLGYAPAAIIGHPARKTWPELQRKWRRVNAESYALYASKPGGRLRWALRSVLLPASAFVHIPRVLMSRQLATSKQRLSALSMLFQQRLWRFGDSLRHLWK